MFMYKGFPVTGAQTTHAAFRVQVHLPSGHRARSRRRKRDIRGKRHFFSE